MDTRSARWVVVRYPSWSHARIQGPYTNRQAHRIAAEHRRYGASSVRVVKRRPDA